MVVICVVARAKEKSWAAVADCVRHRSRPAAAVWCTSLQGCTNESHTARSTVRDLISAIQLWVEAGAQCSPREEMDALTVTSGSVWGPGTYPNITARRSRDAGPSSAIDRGGPALQRERL